MSFSEAFEDTMRIEGSYSNREDDRGGETFAGITRKWFGGWKGWNIVDYHKKEHRTNFVHYLDNDTELAELVKQFYLEEIWLMHRIDDVNSYSPKIAGKLFDQMVNFGDKRPSKWFQRTLNILNRNQKNYPDIIDDGNIGPKTIKTFQLALKTNPIKRIMNVLRSFQGWEYIRIMEGDPTQEANIGWMDRIEL